MEKIALILAAGAGTRMNSNIPKVLNKICGQTLADHVMDALEPVCDRKVMIVKHLKDDVIAACQGRAEFVEQRDGGWGTGWAVISAREILEQSEGRVLVTAGDMPLLRTETFEKLDRAVADGADAAMLYDTVDNPHGYGRMITDEKGMPCNIVEQKELKPEQEGIREINASVYCFDAKALLWALDFLKSDNAANEYYLTDVIPVLYNAGKKIAAVAAEDHSECMGVNTQAQLQEAEDAMLARRAAK